MRSVPLIGGKKKKKDNFIQEYLYIEEDIPMMPQEKKEKTDSQEERGITIIEFY
jgi:hypothetical protein